MKNTVAIIGSHPRTRDMYDHSRTDADVWCFNEAVSAGSLPGATLVFQMHVPEIFRNPANRQDPGHYEWLKTQTACEIVMQEQYPDVPRSTAYPLDDALALGARYFTSSAAYAIALAILRGYKRIELYGVEMESDTEYRYQREGVAYWRGVAEGRGIEFIDTSNILKAPLYGYEGEVALSYDLIAGRIDEVQPDLQKALDVYNAARAECNQALLDALQNNDFGDPLKLAIKKQGQAIFQYGFLQGIRDENKRYKDKADIMTSATGDFVFSRQEFEQAAAAVRNQKQEAETNSNMLAGAVMGLLKSIPAANYARRKRRMDAELGPALAQYFEQAAYAGIYAGVYNENLRYMALLDDKIKAAGGAKSEAVLLQGMVTA